MLKYKAFASKTSKLVEEYLVHTFIKCNVLLTVVHHSLRKVIPIIIISFGKV